MTWQTISAEFQVLLACETVLLDWRKSKSGYMDHFKPMFYEE